MAKTGRQGVGEDAGVIEMGGGIPLDKLKQVWRQALDKTRGNIRYLRRRFVQTLAQEADHPDVRV